jgi:hypothetical protein
LGAVVSDTIPRLGLTHHQDFNSDGLFLPFELKIGTEQVHTIHKRNKKIQFVEINISDFISIFPLCCHESVTKNTYRKEWHPSDSKISHHSGYALFSKVLWCESNLEAIFFSDLTSWC